MKNFLVLSLVLFSLTDLALALASQAPPPPEQGNFRVINSATQAPVANAWVCIADSEDFDRDGVLHSSSGFTDAAGNVALEVPPGITDVYLYAAAFGHGSSMNKYMRSQNNYWGSNTTDIGLESKAAALFWGKLDGAGASGAQISSPSQSTSVLAVAGDDGLFALSVNRYMPLDMAATSDTIQPISWAVDLTLLGTSVAPSVFPVVARQLVDIEVEVTTEPGSPALSSNARVVFCAVDPMLDPGWTRAVPTVGQPNKYRATVESGLPILVIANDGVRFTSVSLPASSAPLSLTLGQIPTATLSVGISMPDSVGGAPMAFGDVKIRLHPSEGGTPLELGSVGVGPTGLVNITGVETGRYSVIWRGSTHSTGSLPFYINPDEAKSVSLIAEMVNPSLPIPGEFSGIAQLNGSLVCIGGNIGRAEVFLRDSVSGAIVQSVQLTAAGNFSFERVPRGVYSITSLGVSDLGETCQQATGSTRVVVDSPVVSVGSVTLYAANALVVFAFKTGSDWIAIEPESGVNMTLKQNGTIIAQGITNEKGFVVFAALNDEAYQVSCSKGNRETSDPVLVDLSSAAPVRFAVTLIQE